MLLLYTIKIKYIAVNMGFNYKIRMLLQIYEAVAKIERFDNSRTFYFDPDNLL